MKKIITISARPYWLLLPCPAALVEEAAASAESLREMARELAKLVSEFKLEEALEKPARPQVAGRGRALLA